MRNRNRIRPLIEPLEEKALLSHMLPHAHYRGPVVVARGLSR